MRICLLNDSFPPVLDGVANVVVNYAKYFTSERSALVAVGTPRYPEADYSGYPYTVIPYPSLDTASVASGYRTGNPFASKEVGKLADFKPDIIHAHCPASAMIIARLLREETDAPIVFTYHTKYDVDIERVVKVKSVAHEGVKAMVSNIEAADEVWVVSRGAGESLSALGFEGEWRVMNNGVDFAKGRVDEKEVSEVTKGYDLPAGVPVFLFVGRLMTYKGLPLILDALKMLSDSGQDFRMLFIGKGPDQAFLEEKARSLDLLDTETSPGKCIFVGPVYDRDTLRAWNTRADLFLFPSTFDTNGLVVREAAACGLASVLIEGSCAAEGVTDGRNGFTIAETPEAMAALLKSVSPDLPKLREIGRSAMDEIYLSWKDCVLEAYDRYQVILEKKRSGAFSARKKLPADYIVSAAAWRMSEQEKLRRTGIEHLTSFKETAVGMLDYIHETEEAAERVLSGVEKKLKREIDHLRKE